MIKFIDDVIKIDSKGNSLIIEKYDNRAELIYYGKKLRDHTFYKYNPYEMRDKYYGSCCDYTDIPSVISSNGECANKTSLVSVIHDGIFSNRFEFIGAEMVEDFYSPLPTARNKGETVCLTYADALYRVSMRPQTNLEKAVSFEAYGDSLMELGIDLGMMRMDETDESGYAARFTSRMLYLKKVDI